MDLRATILHEHSKKQCNKIVSWVGNSQDRFDQLFDLFLQDESLLAARAAWPLSYCVIKRPGFIKKKLDKLISKLKKPNLHDSIKRNSIRLLRAVEIPVKYRGEIMDICFKYVSSPEEPAAIKAFSLAVLDNLSKHYPDIKNELKVIIEDRWNNETAAFHSMAKKIL